jgi:flagellar hook-associated protein 2
MRAFSTRATALSTGPLHLALDGLQRVQTSITDQIASWDNRLALRETALRRQFSAMEAALGQAKNQSTWLAGQIAGLPTYS